MLRALQAGAVDVSCQTLLIPQGKPWPTACGASSVLLCCWTTAVPARSARTIYPGDKMTFNPELYYRTPFESRRHFGPFVRRQEQRSRKLHYPHSLSATAVPVVSHALPLPGRCSPGRHHGVPSCSFSTPVCWRGHGSVRIKLDKIGALARSCAHTHGCSKFNFPQQCTTIYPCIDHVHGRQVLGTANKPHASSARTRALSSNSWWGWCLAGHGGGSRSQVGEMRLDLHFCDK